MRPCSHGESSACRPSQDSALSALESGAGSSPQHRIPQRYSRVPGTSVDCPARGPSYRSLLGTKKRVFRRFFRIVSFYSRSVERASENVCCARQKTCLGSASVRSVSSAPTALLYLLRHTQRLCDGYSTRRTAQSWVCPPMEVITCLDSILFNPGFLRESPGARRS